MKTIIAGSRNITHYSLVKHAIELSEFNITRVVSGAARGIDRLGEQWAKENNIAIERFPADWNKYGKGAGPIRNQQMAEYADALILIWDGKSKGSANMLRYARKAKLKIYVMKVNMEGK